MQPKRNITPLAFLIVAILPVLTGCVMSERHSSPAVAHPTVTTNTETEIADHLVPVVRYGRYTLAELRPELTQRDLSQQVVEVMMPAHLSATVGDGVLHLLQRTGYVLCHTDEANALYRLPLPAAHLHLGPQTLRNALQTLAGPAWRLTLDEALRQVCFVRVQPSESPTFANDRVTP